MNNLLTFAAGLLSIGIIHAQDSPSEEILPPPRPAESERTPPAGVSLAQFASFAESNHPALIAAASDIEVAHGLAVQAGLYPNPQFQGGAGQFAGNDSELPFYLSQRIITAGKLTLDQRAAFQQVYQAEQRYLSTRYQVLTRVRRAFYSALAGEQRIDTLRSLVKLLTQSRDAAERRRKGGRGTRADVLLLEIELRQAQASLRKAEAAQAGFIRQLFAAAGSPEESDTTVDLVGDFNAAIHWGDYQDLLVTVLRSNAQVREAEQEVIRRQLLLRRAEVEPIPDVTVNLGYQRNTNPGELNNKGILNVRLPLPIWNRNQGNRYAAANGVYRAAAEAQAVRVRLGESLADAWRRHRSSTEQVNVLVNELLPTAREGIEVTRKGYEGGQLSLLPLLNAQQGFVRAYLNYIDVQEQRWLAAIDMAGLLQMEVFPPPVQQKVKPNPAKPEDKAPPAPNAPPEP